MPSVRYDRSLYAMGFRPVGRTNPFAAAHGISGVFSRRGGTRLGDGTTVTPNALNLPSDTSITLDPNAAAILAQQKANWIPDTNAGASYDSGTGSGSGGGSGSGLSTMAWLEANAGWIVGALLAMTIFPGVLKKL